MTKFKLASFLLIAFLAINFTACDNEPLEGDFPVNPPGGEAGEGQFIATVDGVAFNAETVTAVLFADGLLVITGVSTTSGETIVLTVEEAGIGSFNITAGTGNQNSGVYGDAEELDNPYISTELLGGSGVMDISAMDMELLTMTGTFSFEGVRFALDGDGNPILDGNGNPVLETISITAGAFNTINYVLDDPGGGQNPTNSFFARVDAVNFRPETITAIRFDVGLVSMVKIEAIGISGDIMRIDIPEDTGEGTFDMITTISNGTDLIGMYNPNTGGENLSSNPGTITIIDFNTATGKIVATFNFTARDPLGIDPTVIEITDGNFDINYEPIPGNTNVVFTANIDGEAYEPEVIIAGMTTFNGMDLFTVNTELGDQRMGLIIPSLIEAGTYDMSSTLINGTELIGIYTPDAMNPVAFNSNPGSIVIIENNPVEGYITGTFTFSAVDATGLDPTVYDITNGEFFIEF